MCAYIYCILFEHCATLCAIAKASACSALSLKPFFVFEIQARCMSLLLSRRYGGTAVCAQALSCWLPGTAKPNSRSSRPGKYAFDTLIQIDQRNPQDAQNRYFPLLQKAFGFFIQALALYALLTQPPEISRLLQKKKKRY